MNLFNKSKVKAGKQTGEQKKDERLFSSVGTTWKKLNSMSPKQAYTWGGIGISVFLFLLMLGSMASSTAEKEDFDDYQTHRYDLVNMPFSSDEAEEYLLASRYPDLQVPTGEGLYTAEEKQERQQEDAAQASTKAGTAGRRNRSTRRDQRNIGSSNGYRAGGGSSGGTTKVEKMGSANLKGGKGSGINSTFGATGDFSNFKNQDKGKEQNNLPETRGSGDARKALFQTAMGSRLATANQDSKMLDAKKALLGSKVDGDGAYLADSAGTNLTGAGDLSLSDIPSTPDLSGLQDKINEAAKKADKDNKKEDDHPWRDFFMELGKMGFQMCMGTLMNNWSYNSQLNKYLKAGGNIDNFRPTNAGGGNMGGGGSTSTSK